MTRVELHRTFWQYTEAVSEQTKTTLEVERLRAKLLNEFDSKYPLPEVPR